MARRLDLYEMLDNTYPCLGSGLCCKKQICWEGRKIYETSVGPCPSLVEKDGRHYCGLILNADEKEEKRLKKSLYIGDGCCMSSANKDRANLARSSRVWKPGDICHVEFMIEVFELRVGRVDENGRVLSVDLGEGREIDLDSTTRILFRGLPQ